MRKRFVTALVISGFLLPFALDQGRASALAKVGNLQVDGEDVVLDGEVYIVPPGSQEVTVTFDYTGASRSTIAVRIEGVGGLRLYETSERYTGDGAAEVVVRADELYAYVAEAVESTSRELVSVVRDISSASSVSSGEVYEALTAIANLLGRVSSQLDILESAQLEGEAAGAATDMRAAIDEIELYLDEATALEVDDIDGRKAQATLMSGPADEMRIASATVAGAVESIDAAAFPESDGEWRYIVSARLTEGINVQDAIADSVEFEVVEPGAPSRISRSGEPTSAATARTGGAGGGTGRGTSTPAPEDEDDDALSGDDDAGGDADQGSGTQGQSTPASGSGAAEDEESDADDAAATAEAIALAEIMSAEEEQAGDRTLTSSGDEAGALPTWTVPAGRSRSAPGSGAETDADADAAAAPDPDGGLNLGILFVGILALIAIAFWMRRRM